MADALSQFLRAQAARPMVWGVSDCILMGADWVLARRAADPAAAWRGAYSDAAGAQTLLGDLGGMHATISAAMASIGVEETTKALRGDIGLIEVLGPAGRAEACGISTGARWAVRAPKGIWIGRATALAVWRV